ncbi:hypothetical protein [Limosilactobacillus caecicola]|uniref:hypothetical protein n=1 Tax=Limosilactobacillus caecicola TaxID=2941332 RepID=UPI00203DBFC6|nr:hypothetical protein [Limosilactobacillus caecicola]
MKIVDFDEVKEVAEGMSPLTWYNWVDETMRNKGNYDMPAKLHISQANDGYFNIMPALSDKFNLATVKMIGRHLLKENEHRPVMMSEMLLYDASTGMLKGVIDGEYLTTLRTGAAAAHSALLFTKKDFQVISLMGLGNIMTVFLDTFMAKLHDNGDDRQLIIKLFKHHNQEKRFAKRFAHLSNVNFVYCDTYDETVDDADLVVSAVTRADEDFVDDQYFKEGVTVIPICTTGFNNCDLFFDKVFTDEIKQIRGFKNFDKFKSLTNVSDVLKGQNPGRQNDQERILVYNYGLGVLDLFFAHNFFNLAKGQQFKYNYPTEKYFM